jgi:hypothetical protein
MKRSASILAALAACLLAGNVWAATPSQPAARQSAAAHHAGSTPSPA